MTQVIALTSRRGQSGKDTLVTEMDKMGLKVKRVAFADPMKDELCEVLPKTQWNYRTMCDSAAKDSTLSSLAIVHLPDSEYSEWLRFVFPNDLHKGRSIRWHLQQFGTEFTREFRGQQHKWLYLALDKITRAVVSGEYDFIVVTDMRETFELKYLKLLYAAVTVRITRFWSNPEVDSQVQHSSDIALDTIKSDVTLGNVFNCPAQLPKQLLEYLKYARI